MEINLVPITYTDVLFSEQGIKHEPIIADGGTVDEVVIRTVEIPIIDGIRLKVSDDKAATLFIGKIQVTFNWTEEMAKMFYELDTYEVIEFLELINRNRWEG